MGGSLRGAWGGGAPGASAGGGGIHMGRIGVWGGGGAHAPRNSPCPPSNHTITINLTLTFGNSHANPFDWAEQDAPNDLAEVVRSKPGRRI